MQWNDVIKRPPARLLRQFAALWLLFFLGLSAWRVWTGRADEWAQGLAILAISVGVAGMIWPSAVRWIYTAWMVAAFPIGWTVSRVLLALLFFGLFTPIATVFRVAGRDPLRLRGQQGTSNWSEKPASTESEQYLRQY